MTSPRFMLRLSVKLLGNEPVKGLEAGPSITLGEVTLTATQRGQLLVLLADGFASEDEAEAFLPRLKSGLWNTAIKHDNVAFKPYFERRDIKRTEDPDKAARNLAAWFGLPVEEPIQPVHGLAKEEGYTIFESHENIRYIAAGKATISLSTGWKNFSGTLTEGIQGARVFANGEEADLATAFDLYLASFYEASTRARFLTLMTCLEVLAPITNRHAVAVQALADFRKQIEKQLSKATEGEEREALAALLREIDFKKETSIRRRLRSLVLSEAPLETDARLALAKKIVVAYDLRGKVVHTGKGVDQAGDNRALQDAYNTTLKAVKLLLRARLRLENRPPTET